jgi:hypothetical protein
MPQSNVIFAYLFAAFVIFITVRGELPKYLGFLLASPKKPAITRGPDLAAPEGTGLKFSDAASVAKTAALFLA